MATGVARRIYQARALFTPAAISDKEARRGVERERVKTHSHLSFLHEEQMALGTHDLIR